MPHQNTPHTRLGRTGLRVSRLCLGTVNFGGRVEEPEARTLLDHALDHGVDFVDTADMYGWRVHKGFTEEMIGRWLGDSPSRRDAVVLATKVGNPVGSGPNDEGLSARHIISACDASLRRLRTDWIDLYQMHRMDPGVPWDEVWQAMETLTAQGKIRYVGASNFSGWGLVSAQEAARRRGFPGLASEQCLYNLLVRHPELETVPAASAYGIGVLVWSPLHGGLLSGVLRKRAEGTAVKSAQGRADSALPIHRNAVEEFEGLCAELDRDPAEVGLAWALARPGVTSVVIGPRTPAHVDGALRALAEPLDTAVLARLDSLFPPVGRGGPAPDAWLG
ncbi:MULTISPECIES: aldo/keto reductase [Nocardiopsis]|uniref:Oxidoreductase n=1 Tax=Nocardiopsis sinuspersici TaxID=501010 RepID=A0A1V3BYW5_9ACTN|nr:MULTISPECIES: aldo/keto reductase [Nocardiopsis]OOC53330.1 oxidoreductase [Nocardiopsis sinuspersici]